MQVSNLSQNGPHSARNKMLSIIESPRHGWQFPSSSFLSGPRPSIMDCCAGGDLCKSNTFRQKKWNFKENTNWYLETGRRWYLHTGVLYSHFATIQSLSPILGYNGYLMTTVCVLPEWCTSHCHYWVGINVCWSMAFRNIPLDCGSS